MDLIELWHIVTGRRMHEAQKDNQDAHEELMAALSHSRSAAATLDSDISDAIRILERRGRNGSARQ